MFVLREVLLLCSITICLSSAKAPKEGQRCQAEGKTGKCVIWHKCAPIAQMLQRNPVMESELIYAEKFICGYKRHTPYHCCVDGMSPRPQTPATTQKPDRPKPNDEDKNMERNALMNHRNRQLLPLETCGKVDNKYIVGGEATTLGEYPWLAIIHYRHPRKPGQFMCGGSLINKRYVLTAGHCLHPDKLFGYSPDMVRLGENNLATNPDSQHGKEGRLIQADPVMDFLIERTIIHDDYVALNRHQYHDIGLIRMNRDAPETRYVKPICLPTPEADRSIITSDQLVKVAGWGNTDTGSRSSLLLKVAIPFVDTNTCAAAYASLGRTVTSSQLCAGTKGKDSCKGDSGGPLMGIAGYSNYMYSRTFAIGVVSYGHTDCGEYQEYPGVYTRVLPYVGWILDHLKP